MSFGFNVSSQVVILFQNLKKEERAKMELWGMAQQELIENSTVNNLTFEVLQQTRGHSKLQITRNGNAVGILL